MAPLETWQEAAACKTLPLEMFFPPAEQEAEAAKAICSGCTVKEPCLEAALTAGERFGIWGGLSSDERRNVAARRRARAATARAAGLDVTLGAR
ncbi:MAG TPA: WhiB family transcriptional regulator [Actinomycetota bacterium]|nr:WhiB family transcriptional regulator [Actinomycetota bacterium]